MPAVLICFYDLQKLGADMLVEVLRTHPKRVASAVGEGSVVIRQVHDYLEAAGRR